MKPYSKSFASNLVLLWFSFSTTADGKNFCNTRCSFQETVPNVDGQETT